MQKAAGKIDYNLRINLFSFWQNKTMRYFLKLASTRLPCYMREKDNKKIGLHINRAITGQKQGTFSKGKKTVQWSILVIRNVNCFFVQLISFSFK